MLAEVLNRAGRRVPRPQSRTSSADGWATTYRQLDQFSDECAVWWPDARRRARRRCGVARDSVDDRLHRAFRRTGQARRDLGGGQLVAHRARARRCARVRRAIGSSFADPAFTEGLPASAPVLEVVGGANASTTRSCAAHSQRSATGAAARSAAVGSPSASRPVRPACRRARLFRDEQIRAIAASDTGGSGSVGYRHPHRIAATQFAHVGGMTKIPWMLASGGTIHLMHRWRAQSVMQLIHEFRMPALNGGPDTDRADAAATRLRQLRLLQVKAIIVGHRPVHPRAHSRSTRALRCALFGALLVHRIGWSRHARPRSTRPTKRRSTPSAVHGPVSKR